MNTEVFIRAILPVMDNSEFMSRTEKLGTRELRECMDFINAPRLIPRTKMIGRLRRYINSQKQLDRLPKPA